MKYYKLISDTTFIGIANSDDFVIQNIITKCFLTSDENFGQFVQNGSKLYRDYWMAPLTGNTCEFINVNIIEITEEEYNIYFAAIHANEEIPIIEPIPGQVFPDVPEPIDEEDPNDITSLEFIRKSKLNEMSAACRATIESGFDLILRGETHHFSLTTQDQLNLMSLSSMTQTQELIPYHADGEECTFYTPQEINEILTAASDFKNYQIAYNNALKVYINTLDTIEAIAAITYGTPIPDEYKSDVLRVLE